jgi:hypothetical protein
MQNNLDPLVAQAAVALRKSHPQAPPLEALDLAMRQRTGNLADLGETTWPTTPFGQLLALCLDRGMTPEEWLPIDNPLADPVMVAAMRQIWRDVVLTAFAKRYELTLRATWARCCAYDTPSALQSLGPRRSALLALHQLRRLAVPGQRGGLHLAESVAGAIEPSAGLQRLGTRGRR